MMLTMSQAHRRKKAPAEIRRQLLSATGSLALEAGPSAVTMDAVARRAGVSKGGLQHHFPSRQALLDTLFEEVWARYRSRFLEAMRVDEEPRGRVARAYLTAIDVAMSAEIQDEERLFAVFFVGDAEFRRRWTERMLAEMPAETPDDPEVAARLLICRLAADGLWLNDLARVHAISDEVRGSIVRRLRESTRY